MKDQKIPPPIEWKGPIATVMKTRILDQHNCHSCGDEIKRGDEWGAIGDCPCREREARIVFLRLCGACWEKATRGMKELERGWER